MTTLREAAEEFLAQPRLAVAGVSRDSRQPANLIFRRLRDAGHDVFAINPNAETVEGAECFASVDAVPGQLDGVVVVTAPSDTDAVVADCVAAGVPRVGYACYPRGLPEHVRRDVRRRPPLHARDARRRREDPPAPARRRLPAVLGLLRSSPRRRRVSPPARSRGICRCPGPSPTRASSHNPWSGVEAPWIEIKESLRCNRKPQSSRPALRAVRSSARWACGWPWRSS